MNSYLRLFVWGDSSKNLGCFLFFNENLKTGSGEHTMSEGKILFKKSYKF